VSQRFDELLQLLAQPDLELIVVGMFAGVLQGAPMTTADVDVVHRRSTENAKRLAAVLAKIGAVYRHDDRRISPGESHLMGPGHQLLETSLGDLDCLGSIDGDKTYEDILDSTVRMDLGEGLSIRVLSLPTLIEIKRRAGRPKDLAALPVLEATLDELRRSK
jgi:hypothetical protein